MLCLDSYVIMDVLSDNKEKALKAQKYLTEAGARGGIISSTVLAEVFFHVARRNTVDNASKAITFIKSMENLHIVDANQDISILAGELRHKYYKKSQKELSYLDCIHLATAINKNCNKFITGDKDFEGIEEIETEVY